MDKLLQEKFLHTLLRIQIQVKYVKYHALGNDYIVLAAADLPDGELRIQFHDGFCATMTGPVTKVCHGETSAEMFASGDGARTG